MLLTKLGLLFIICELLIFNRDITTNDPVITEFNLGAGSQPELSVDDKGIIRAVYGLKIGKEKDLYFVTSKDGGKSYSKPFLLGNFSQMGLGMGRGPQITTTKDYTVVTVGDHHGDLFALRLTNASGKWSAPVKVNDTDTTAKEALSGMAAGKENLVYTVWLDLRLGRNNLYGALSRDGGLTWEKNQLIYKGSQEGICECCKPSVSIDQTGKINVMFRNKLDGARNMYLISSVDNGQHFQDAQKLGEGNYTINACPMDGGDLTADKNGNITTVWRRQMEVFVCSPGKPERKLGSGRTPVNIQTDMGTTFVWEQNGEIQFRMPGGSKTFSLGKGTYPKLALMTDHKTVMCAMERDGQVVINSITPGLD